MSDNPKKTLSLKTKNGDEGAGRIEERLHKVLAQAGLAPVVRSSSASPTA